MRPPSTRSPRRRGFTLAEVLVTITLVAVVFAVAIPFVHTQARGVARQGFRLDAQLNARFGASTIERELRAAGVGVLDDQPLLVQAHPLAVTFNADLVSRDTLFDGAVNVDPDARPGATGGMTAAERRRLPLGAWLYPARTYLQQGNATRAETIAFWLSPDSTSPRADEHILWRRANAMPPEVVARGLVVRPGERVFRYFRANAAGTLVEIDSLPIEHRAEQHGSAADTGRSALTDSVRVVRVQLVARSTDRRTGRQTVDTVRASVRLMNAGLLRRKTCGDAPLAATPLFTTAVEQVDGVPRVRLAWLRTGEEAAGERDVERYVIYRRRLAEPDFGEPLASVAAGSAAYTYVDPAVARESTYVYALAAQDCTPQNSAPSVAAPVTILP